MSAIIDSSSENRGVPAAGSTVGSQAAGKPSGSEGSHESRRPEEQVALLVALTRVELRNAAGQRRGEVDASSG
jgi:hypothetical protein